MDIVVVASPILGGPSPPTLLTSVIVVRSISTYPTFGMQPRGGGVISAIKGVVLMLGGAGFRRRVVLSLGGYAHWAGRGHFLDRQGTVGRSRPVVAPRCQRSASATPSGLALGAPKRILLLHGIQVLAQRLEARQQRSNPP